MGSIPMVVDATRCSWTEARSCQLDGIKVSETIVAAGSDLGDHFHQTGQICFLLEGEMRERQIAREERLRPGKLRLHAPGFRHRVTVEPESDVLALLLFIDADRWIRTTPAHLTTTDGPLWNYGAQIRREFARLDDAGRAALEGWTMLALSAAARGAAAPPQRRRLG